jgi:hypothetical protein
LLRLRREGGRETRDYSTALANFNFCYSKLSKPIYSRPF